MTPDRIQQTRADAAAAERQRIDRILGAPEAKGRYELAKTLALKNDVAADDAIQILAASPKESSRFGPGARDPQSASDSEIDAEVKRILEA